MIASTSVLTTSCDRQLDEIGGVVGVGILAGPSGNSCARSRPRLDQVGGLERVGAGRERHGDAGAGMAVDVADRSVIFGAELDPGDVLETDRRAARAGS